MRVVRALLPLLALLLVSAPGCGRFHEQLEGRYAFTATEIIQDDCSLLASPEALWDGSLLGYGDVVEIEYELLGLDLTGSYLAGVERFSLDGSVANVTTTLGTGEECLLDRVSVHLDATTVEASVFEGTLRVRYEAERPDTCVCQLLTRYRAVHQ